MPPQQNPKNSTQAMPKTTAAMTSFQNPAAIEKGSFPRGRRESVLPPPANSTSLPSVYLRSRNAALDAVISLSVAGRRGRRHVQRPARVPLVDSSLWRASWIIRSWPMMQVTLMVPTPNHRLASYSRAISQSGSQMSGNVALYESPQSSLTLRAVCDDPAVKVSAETNSSWSCTNSLAPSLQPNVKALTREGPY